MPLGLGVDCTPVLRHENARLRMCQAPPLGTLGVKRGKRGDIAGNELGLDGLLR